MFRDFFLNLEKIIEGAEVTDWLIAISTIAYTCLTAVLILENRKMRIQSEQPQIDIFTERGADFGGKLYLIIKNNGLGGAHDIQITIDDNLKFPQNVPERLQNLSNQGPFKNGIPFLAPKSQRELLLGIFMGDEFHKLIKYKSIIHTEYKNSANKKIKRDFVLSFVDLENTFLLPENPLFTISKTLEKLQKNIDRLITGSSKLRVITQTKKEYLEEEATRNEKHLKKVKEMENKLKK